MPAWLGEFIEKWQAQSRSTQFTVVGVVIAAIVLMIIPWRASAEEGNPLGVQVDSQPLSGSDYYSAEPLTVSGNGTGVSLGDSSVETSESSVVASSVELTKNADYSTDLASLTAEYEANSASLAQSRSNDPSYTAPNVSSSSSASSSASSSSSSTADASSSSSSEMPSAGTYTVQSGDNAYRIATNNGLTLDEFLAMNGKTEASVTPGEVVRIQ
ncbi:LysM repeat protein [Aerococcus sp. 150760007-1]|uniref:LysM peptidoglycan-binding domain-containing protein n=1 Tax=Aerococcus urinaeequi TaxID=51665 RepID=A0ABR5ZZT0_9LACT|nr:MULTISPECIES: LysM domain-containing protein [Lactobacillales]KAF3299424.1 LysM peptidoglycan-binding domain-containing protein [Carnobacterium sp. PL17RED31]KAF3298861.1 LysM peptidoglycan-binding domain-containing protein [Carnobacterium sp. PL12RED10]MBA5747238.1 LysM peptidoglycan-binding domain-containing protein [Aerococcus urinaeequi]MBA5830022.1 LysM peptidoglycan-binding domain-containing protein [Aerococcus urinaeequi]MBA5860915.1 LysM peptidoglycan-binding domain-containing prote